MWPSRDAASQSGECCPICNTEVHPYKFKYDDTIPIDERGNLKVSHDWCGLEGNEPRF